MFYDKNQLEKDISKILDFRGEQKQKGFYTVYELVKGGLKIVLDCGSYQITFFGKEYETNSLPMDSVVANVILQMIVDLEEARG